MTTATKTQTRTCMKCKQPKELFYFKSTSSPFFPGKRSLICTPCLERMCDPENFDQIDRLCRYLDLPFDLKEWTRLYESYGEHTLSAYFELISDDAYRAVSWSDENKRWIEAKNTKTIDEEIEIIDKAKIRKLQKKWSDTYSTEDLMYLEDLYNKVVATQNASTPILKTYATDYCEVELRIKKGLRAGLDVKKDMDARDNIIKIARFDAANSKSSSNLETVGELVTYYGKQGWHPSWHVEPQDSVDFTMNNIQTYLRRLVTNDASIVDEIENKRNKYNTIAKVEDLEQSDFEEKEVQIKYEDEEASDKELSGWND